MSDFEILKKQVADQELVIDQSGGDLTGYIKKFGDVTGREKYAADTALLAELRQGLHEVVTDLVMADLLS
jgi:hypothetical protein